MKKEISKKAIFVVHKHKSKRLHYDFRLQIGDILISWAIPKGPSISARDKRLAVRVEDHELSYATFEGRIPPGNYGAGAVMIWDRGTWRMQDKKQDPRDALQKGRIKFYLEGKKLKGNWGLIRLKGQDKNWLLMKEKDGFHQEGIDILEKEPDSIISGKSIEQIEKDPNMPELSCMD